MQGIASMALLLLLSAGLGISYLIYRQLDTDIVVFSAAPQYEQNANGEMCGTVDFSLEARSLGRWALSIADGQEASGYVEVEGNGTQDIGLRIRTPSNRLVYQSTNPEHVLTFELTQTIRGDYEFEFDNRHSALTQKHVTVFVCLT